MMQCINIMHAASTLVNKCVNVNASDRRSEEHVFLNVLCNEQNKHVLVVICALIYLFIITMPDNPKNTRSILVSTRRDPPSK
jgi:hypothetical protein